MCIYIDIYIYKDRYWDFGGKFSPSAQERMGRVVDGPRVIPGRVKLPWDGRNSIEHFNLISFTRTLSVYRFDPDR